MSESVRTNTSIWSKGMLSVIVAQFLSAFGDNALLFATLALLKAQFYPDWSQPVLQMVFVGAYILFAPFVGQIADSFAKGRVMMVANGLKLAGAAGICLGINPFVGYTLVGIGAAAYSPAKYGILGELTTGDKLVKANGLMEASTIGRFCSVPSWAAYWPTGMSSLRWLPARWPTLAQWRRTCLSRSLWRRVQDNPGGCRR